MGGRGSVSATNSTASVSTSKNTKSAASGITGAFAVGRNVYYERDGKLYTATKSEYKRGKGTAISGMDLSTMRRMQRSTGKKIEEL